MATSLKRNTTSTRATIKKSNNSEPANRKSSSLGTKKKTKTTRRQSKGFARLGKTTRLVSNISWESTTEKLVKAKNLNQLRKELARVAAELKKLEVRIEMSPAVYERWQQLSATYQELLNHLHRLQLELDREVTAAATFLDKTKQKWAQQLAKFTNSASWPSKSRSTRSQSKANR